MKKIQRVQDIIDFTNQKITELQEQWKIVALDNNRTDEIEQDIKNWELVLFYATEAQAEIDFC